MTLEETIAHHRWCADNCEGEVRDEHLQMVEWLEELVMIKAENEKLRSLVCKWYPHMLKRVGRDVLEQWGQMDVVKELRIEVG